MQANYDQDSAEEIESFGKHLLNRTLRTQPGMLPIPEKLLDTEIGGATRGSFGNILESYYYGINPGNDSAPDFPRAGVELKSTPLKRLSKGGYSAKERLVLGMINYRKEGEITDFEESGVIKKNAVIMLVSYEHQAGRAAVDHPVRVAGLVKFKELSEKDQLIIKQDWKKITEKIRANRAHELSEGDTDYLGACTKAATGENRTKQMDGSEAKPRAFSLKSGYMTVLLRQMLAPEKASEEFEEAVDAKDLAAKSLEEEILSRFAPHIGKMVKEIHAAVGDGLSLTAKDYYASLARRMIGVRGKKIEEFEKAEITMKTIQLRADGMPKEDMSFPTMRFTNLVEEDWEAPDEDGENPPSAFRLQLQKRFLFVVYRCDKKCEKAEERRLEKAFFWTMPHDTLESEVKSVWNRMKNAVINSDSAKFPKKSDNPVAHVRPHASNAADTFLLPDGTPATKRCFWLDKKFIKKVINEYGS